jgi:hypothetical protein
MTLLFILGSRPQFRYVAKWDTANCARISGLPEVRLIFFRHARGGFTSLYRDGCMAPTWRAIPEVKSQIAVPCFQLVNRLY